MTMRIHGDKIEFPDGTEQFTASSGGGVEAQPPVYFMGIVKDAQSLDVMGEDADVVFGNKVNDSDNGFNADGSIYTIQKDGVYKLNTTLTTAIGDGSLRYNRAVIQVKFVGTGTFQALSSGLSFQEKTVQSGSNYSQVVVNCIKELNKGDELKVVWAISDNTKVNLYKDGLSCTFSGHMISSFTESSGGGDYTPEKMVWEDKLSERELEGIYKNDNDVPLYVQIYTYANGSGKNAQMWIDGKFFGAMGNSSGTTEGLHTNLFVIPAHSEYQLRSGTNAPDLQKWHEARMPVAVGTGGDSATLESLGIPNHDKVTVDTSGWLAVNGALQSNSDNESLVLFNTGVGETKAQVAYKHSDNSLNFHNGGSPKMSIDAVGDVQIKEYLQIKEEISSTSDDRITLSPNNVPNLRVYANGTVNFANLPTFASPGNVYISNGGFIYKSTATTYSAEEVDQKLAVKDKLIEKLSARLDKLEKRVK
jgi:hypothetical protein